MPESTSSWARALRPTAGRAGLATAAAVAIACSSSTPPNRASSSSTADAGSSSSGCMATDAAAGPPGSCTQACNVTSACLALSSNTNPTRLDFRIRTLQIAAPDTLKLPIVQQGLIDMGIALPNACCEMGDGGFNILLSLDTAANTLTAGGARPSDDPLNAGYCYLATTSNGATIAPVTAAASKAADGSWSTAQFPQTFEIPIYAHGDVGNLVVLPLSAARIENFAISPDGNCVGRFGAACDGGVGWNPVATLSGYITLEDADRVLIPDLSYNSLCTLLEPAMTTGAHCTRGSDGAIVAKGDYCSTTNSPATSTCADAVRLSATFAASAVRIGTSCGDAAAPPGDASPDATGADGSASADAAPGPDASP